MSTTADSTAGSTESDSTTDSAVGSTPSKKRRRKVRYSSLPSSVLLHIMCTLDEGIYGFVVPVCSQWRKAFRLAHKKQKIRYTKLQFVMSSTSCLLYALENEANLDDTDAPPAVKANVCKVAAASNIDVLVIAREHGLTWTEKMVDQAIANKRDLQFFKELRQNGFMWNPCALVKHAFKNKDVTAFKWVYKNMNRYSQRRKLPMEIPLQFGDTAMLSAALKLKAFSLTKPFLKHSFSPPPPLASLKWFHDHDCKLPKGLFESYLRQYYEKCPLEQLIEACEYLYTHGAAVKVDIEQIIREEYEELLPWAEAKMKMF
jgi:hypothetical protein